MANFLDGAENGVTQKSIAQKIGDAASVNLSTQTWTEKHEIANNAGRMFRKLDSNGDRVLNNVDFDNVEQRHGEFYQSERNTASFLKQNYHAVRDLNMDTCKCDANANEKGITIEDIHQFQTVSKQNFNARSKAIADAATDSILPLGLTALSIGSLIYLSKNPGDTLNLFKPMYAFGAFLTAGATVHRWTELNDETLKYENRRKAVGDMTFPSNYESYGFSK